MPQTVTMKEFNSHEQAFGDFYNQGDSSYRRRRRSISSTNVTCSASPPGDVQSSYIVIYTDTSSDMLTPDTQNEVTISLKLDRGAPADTQIFVSDRSNPCTFRKLETIVHDGTATASTSEEGVYVAATPAVTACVTTATVLLAVITLLIGMILVIVYFSLRRGRWERVKTSVMGMDTRKV